MICYRIVEVKNGKLLSLFHATNGSRIFPDGKWLYANKKVVREGKNGHPYLSGFHVFKSRPEAIKFFNKMFRNRNNRIIVSCEATKLRKKLHARGEVFLADKIRLNYK